MRKKFIIGIYLIMTITFVTSCKNNNDLSKLNCTGYVVKGKNINFNEYQKDIANSIKKSTVYEKRKKVKDTDIVYMGHNADGKQIEWVVLEKIDGKALLTTKNYLFYSEEKDLLWTYFLTPEYVEIAKEKDKYLKKI